ncbi:MAG: sporulation protein YqfD [Oscillospiraceae bacterium]|nr:sporulation protein YqfD [Oscillospiraceae bacterium]
MNRLVRFLRGYYRVRIRGAAPELALNRLAEGRIHFWDLRRVDDFTQELSVRKRDLAEARRLTERVLGEAELVREAGLLHSLRGLRRRRAFAAAVALILAAAYVLPGFIWCLTVEGNEQVPSEQILRELAELGVGFGTWGDSIAPQELKNEMLVRIPQLEWLTVNHSGGLATVIVRERETAPAVIDRRTVTNLIASRDCVITRMEVLSGQAVRQPGQAVLAGEVLVSGYADWEHCVQATRALGEVYGRTQRRLDAVTPVEWAYEGAPGAVHTRYALLLGRKRINFYQDSGIWGAGCDKMVAYRQLTLPGDHAFPVTLVVETAVERPLEMRSAALSDARSLLVEGTSQAVRADMVAGEIVQQRCNVKQAGGLYCLSGTFSCVEMVARSVPAILWESEEGT